MQRTLHKHTRWSISSPLNSFFLISLFPRFFNPLLGVCVRSQGKGVVLNLAWFTDHFVRSNTIYRDPYHWHSFMTCKRMLKNPICISLITEINEKRIPIDLAIHALYSCSGFFSSSIPNKAISFRKSWGAISHHFCCKESNNISKLYHTDENPLQEAIP